MNLSDHVLLGIESLVLKIILESKQVAGKFQSQEVFSDSRYCYQLKNNMEKLLSKEIKFLEVTGKKNEL